MSKHCSAARTVGLLAFVVSTALFVQAQRGGPVPRRAAPSLPDGDLTVSIVRAPVAPDGTTAGAVTDFVLNFMDRNPAVDGISILAGGTVQLTLDPSFLNTDGGPNTGVILQGWPQSPPAPPPLFPWTTTVNGNTITMTLDADFLVGTFGPGPKQAHMILFGFQNPSSPGIYPVSIEIQPDPASPDVLQGFGFVQIIPRARPSVNAISLFSGPPGPPPPFFNPLFQTASLGEEARQVGFYLWDADSQPSVGVDVEMTSPAHGRLVKNGQSVGQVWVDAPPGARDFELTTLGPSTEGPAFVTGVPVGILTVRFKPDPLIVGPYTITLRMNGGNDQQYSVTVVE